MARKPKVLTKTETAAVITENSDIIGMMAIESLDALGNEVLADILETEAIAELTDLDEVVAQLDAVDATQASAIEMVLEPQATSTEETTPAADGSIWEKALSEIGDELVDLGVHAVAKAIDERAAFEAANGNDNIQRTLTKVRNQLATKRATRAMLAAGFNEAQINRSVHQGKRYNVYALGKLADVLYGVSGGAINNAVNNAIMRSLFRFKKAGTAFTMDMAKAAVSDKIRVEAAVRALLIRHTVAPSTAPTQASSTMQALVDLGVVSRSGSERNPIFALTDAPIVAKLDQMLQAA